MKNIFFHRYSALLANKCKTRNSEKIIKENAMLNRIYIDLADETDNDNHCD